MEHQRDYGGRNTKVKTTLVCLDADVVPSPFPHLVICNSLPTEQVLDQCSPKFSCATICLPDGAGAECCHSPASTRACHDQELIDFMAGGEPCTAGTAAPRAMLAHPGSPGEKRVVKEGGGKGNRNFFSSSMSLHSSQ